ncbi:MAG: ABC transporter ATP-binding protein, partial [Desulfamplus sp.]|nr:ABC transporter ATP-binding protein [Desulfamplus sp.]
MKNYHLLKPYIIECRFQILAGFLSLLIVDILQLFIPRIIKWAIDGITLTSISTTELLRYALYIVASAAFISIFRFCWRYLIMGPARKVEEGIREQLFNHIQTLPATFFDKHTAGDIMAHATNDMTNIRMALSMGIVGLTDTIVLGCAAIMFMAYIHLELTLLALLPMPFIALFTKVFSKKLFDAYMDVQAGFSDLMESTRERFAGIRIIKAFNREEFEVDAMQRESREFVRRNM